MDYRKINSHIILLGIVIVVGLLVAMVGRAVALGHGADAGTANLTFLIVLGVCAVIYLIIIATLSQVVIPWIMKRLPVPKKEEETWLAPGITPKPQTPDWKELHDREVQSKLSLFREYTHLSMGPYVSETELARLDEYVELFAREVSLPKETVPMKPARLKNADLFHFGWNMQYYFQVGRREDVVPWLQAVFSELRELSFSTIKGKLHDYQTRRHTIANIDDIPKYMAEKKA